MPTRSPTGREFSTLDTLKVYAYYCMIMQPARVRLRDDLQRRANRRRVDGQVAGIFQLTVLPGLSRAMLGWAIEAARQDGCGLVQLTSDKRPADAIRFYESLGFEAKPARFHTPVIGANISDVATLRSQDRSP